MTDLCVVQGVVASQGADILGVPKQVFTYWKDKFRLGKYQLLFDQAQKAKAETVAEYTAQLEAVDLTREFKHADVQSLEGFRELLERHLELQKAKRVLYDPDGFEKLSYIMHIEFLEHAIEYVDSYCSGKLHSDFEREAHPIQDEMKRM